MFQNLVDRFRSWLYDRLIVSFTSVWYGEVLALMEPGTYLLDVGIGTGTALFRNEQTIRSKSLKVKGVDYDASYVAKCSETIVSSELTDFVSVICESIYDYKPTEEEGVKPYDAVYFSGSFMILPDKESALKRVMAMLKDSTSGSVFFTQTFEQKRNPFLEWFKPKLSYWTSIDFGNVTYEDEFDQVIDNCGLKIVRKQTIQDGKDVPGVRSSVLVEVRRGT